MLPIFRFMLPLLLLSGTLLRAQTIETRRSDSDQNSTTSERSEKSEKPEQFEVAKPLPDAPPTRTPRVRVHRWEQHHSSSRTVFGQNITDKSGETASGLCIIGGTADVQGSVDGDLVVIGGNATVSGTVDGSVTVVGGALKCSGRIARDTVVVLGGADLTSSADLGHDAVLIGGPFNLAEGAKIDRERVIIPLGDVLPKVAWIKDWLVHGLLMGRLLPFRMDGAWAVAGIFAGIYLLALLIFPAAGKAVYSALEERPVTSIISGLLAMILFAPLVTLLAISIVGIAVIPFLNLALILSLVFGKVGVLCFIGRNLGRSANASFLQAPFFAFIVGAALFALACTIPVFGIFAWGLGTLFGLGGAIVALSRTFQREQASVPPASVRATTIIPAYASATAATPSSATPVGTPPDISSTAGATAIPPALGTQNDTLLLPRAGFWKRLLAAIVDLLVIGLSIFILHAFFLPFAVLYFVGMWAWKGATIGCLVLGLKVVRTDGTPVTFLVALVRCLFSFLSGLVLFLGFFWIGWDHEKQGWHDKIAGTVVVKVPEGLALL
jgi:uncharacterized RDD family membrane protein YckC